MQLAKLNYAALTSMQIAFTRHLCSFQNGLFSKIDFVTIRKLFPLYYTLVIQLLLYANPISHLLHVILFFSFSLFFFQTNCKHFAHRSIQLSSRSRSNYSTLFNVRGSWKNKINFAIRSNGIIRATSNQWYLHAIWFPRCVSR